MLLPCDRGPKLSSCPSNAVSQAIFRFCSMSKGDGRSSCGGSNQLLSSWELEPARSADSPMRKGLCNTVLHCYRGCACLVQEGTRGPGLQAKFVSGLFARRSHRRCKLFWSFQPDPRRKDSWKKKLDHLQGWPPIWSPVLFENWIATHCSTPAFGLLAVHPPPVVVSSVAVLPNTLLVSRGMCLFSRAIASTNRGVVLKFSDHPLLRKECSLVAHCGAPVRAGEGLWQREKVRKKSGLWHNPRRHKATQ